MLESFSENSVYWILGVAVVALLITIVGFLTGTNLPSKERKRHVRKFALIGIAVFCFSLSIFKPFVSNYSSVESLDEIKVGNLGTIEDVAKLEKQQTRTIERLREEVVELRSDAYRMNLYYSGVVQLLSMVIAMGALSYAFGKKEDSDD